jgi:hypothetical protein
MRRAVITLAIVGVLLMAFTFAAISDGKVGNAVESGIAGVVMLGASWLLAKRTIMREPSERRRRRREWVTAEERAKLATATNEPSFCAACKEEALIAHTCEECSLVVHVDCLKRHRAEAHELSAGVFR